MQRGVVQTVSELTRELYTYAVVKRTYISYVTKVSRVMSTSPPAKRSAVTIGTHDGSFHCDEALACYMLKQLPEYKDALIKRTRDPNLLSSCDIVVDVGGVYDPSQHRYDHHQRSFKDTMNSLNPAKKWTTKLSSAGLVYYHFGERVIGELVTRLSHTPVGDGDIIPILYDKIYENLIEEVDAIDNGIEQTDGKPRYSITTTLSSRVGRLNPLWNEPSSREDADSRFAQAMETVGAELVDRVKYYSAAWWPARELVIEALTSRHEIDSSGQILCFKNGGLPWKDHLFQLEEEMNIDPTIKFVLYQDQNNKWRVQCVPIRLHSFENRLSLLSEWQGLRDAELTEKSGIKGCIFVHASGFIGGNETYEGVLEMAKRTINSQNSA